VIAGINHERVRRHAGPVGRRQDTPDHAVHGGDKAIIGGAGGDYVVGVELIDGAVLAPPGEPRMLLRRARQPERPDPVGKARTVLGLGDIGRVREHQSDGQHKRPVARHGAQQRLGRGGQGPN